MTQIQLSSADDFAFGAYEALPVGTCAGAVVVIQEIFGVNSHIREVVDGYAADGYYAIAPAIFDRVEAGLELAYDEAGIARGVEVARTLLDIEQALADIQATIEHAAQRGKVGVVGYCFGGLLTWLSACRHEGVAAASSYYGGGVTALAEMTPKCPVILHFGERDEHIPVAGVADFSAQQAQCPTYIYAADHGFNCDQRESFDAAASTLARERTLALFAQHLRD